MSLAERVLDDYERLLAGVSVVVVSDYGKGGLCNVPQIVSLARKRAIPVVVDPKGTDFFGLSRCNHCHAEYIGIYSKRRSLSVDRGIQ